jgi:hypothetical protein
LFTLLQHQNYSFLSTGHPKYWPTDPTKQPDFLDFFVTNGISSTYSAIESSYDLSSDHSPVIATISSSPIYIHPTPRLHTSRTNLCVYRTKFQDDINLRISLQSCTEVEVATNNFISLLQAAARQATPPQVYKKYVVNIPIEIKKLFAEKRKAREKWQRSHAPSDKTAYNRLSSNLKSKLRTMRATSFTKYVSTLSRYDNPIWKPITSSRKPVLASPPLRLETPTKDRWAKSDKDKAVMFAKHLAEVFQPQEQEADEELLEYRESSAQPVAPIKPITPKELKAEISLLHSRKAPCMNLITPKMLKELPPKACFYSLTYTMPFSDITTGLTS